MKTNILKPIRWWALVLCCMLLCAARAQDVETPAPGKDATVQAPGTSAGDVKQGAGSQKGDDAPEDDDRPEHAAPKDDEASRAPAPGDQDDEWTSQSSTGSTGSHRHRYTHHGENGDAVVSIGHKAELRAGEHADSVVAIFGSAISAGDVDNAVVSVLGNTRVTGKVGDAAVAVMGSVYVNGEVEGDVVAVLGNVELGPEARVRGNVVIVGGELTRDPSAAIDGHVQTVITTNWEGFDWVRPWVERCLLYGRPLAFAPGLEWAWGVALGLLALYVFIAFVFRGAVEHCVQIFESRPGHSILAALLAMLLTPVLFVLLFITVLGIAAIPFLVFRAAMRRRFRQGCHTGIHRAPLHADAGKRAGDAHRCGRRGGWGDRVGALHHPIHRVRRIQAARHFGVGCGRVYVVDRRAIGTAGARGRP